MVTRTLHPVIRRSARSIFSLALSLALACTATTPPAPGPAPERSAPLASAASGTHSAVRVETGLLSPAAGSDPKISIFRGIPFAAPPVGDLRWRPPQPASPWSEIRSAAEFGANCQQQQRRRLLPWTEEYMPRNGVSEDCLSLNVWTAHAGDGERAPVLVYIHGGAYTGGSGDVLLYDGERLARRGIVVVTINYRLGVFGFFAHPSLTLESPQRASGNYGLLDQIAALEWVQRNIAAFGGDPHQVTVAGQSAGAGSVHLLTTSPLARGLFQRAIAQSGPWRQRQKLADLAEVEANGTRFAAAFATPTLAELRALPAPELLQRALKSSIPFRPSVDGWVVPDQVPAVYARREQIDVPLLTGVTADEGSSRETYGTLGAEAFRASVRERFPALANDLIALYAVESDAEAHERQKDFARSLDLAELAAWRRVRAQSGSSKDFGYYFERAIPWPEHPRYQAFHSAELPYMFDNLDKLDRPWDSTDRELSHLMARYWVGFIERGDPNVEGLPQWPSDPERVMRLGAEPHVEVLPRGPAALAFTKALQ